MVSDTISWNKRARPAVLKRVKKEFVLGAGAALAIIALPAGASCGSAYCIVNTDWSSQGAWVEAGGRFDLHYESIDQDQPRTGTHNIAVGEIPRDHDELLTRNRNWIASGDWSFGNEWGLGFSIPYVDRHHEHFHNGEVARELEVWDFRQLGDARVMARYDFLDTHDDPAHPHSMGLNFGIKLPTGKYDVTNAAGEEAERSLQPGTGTTDLLLGVHWHGGAPLEGLSWFARAQAQFPLNSRAGYKPGKELIVDGGLRYAATRDLGLMLQLNYQAKGRDSGANAEPEDSGKRQLFATPGVSWNFAKNAQLYAFAQLALYQDVNGVQLTADRSWLAGVSFRF